MKLPRSIHAFVAMILVACVPWSCCGLGFSACCTAATAPAEADAEAGRPSCCRHACHDEPTDDTPSKPSVPSQECGSPCCGPKAPPTVITLDISFDTIGITMPLPVAPSAIAPEGAGWVATLEWSRPPGAPCGRAALRAHCIQVT